MPFTSKQRRTYQNICHLTERGVLIFMKDLLKTRYQKCFMTPSYLIAVGDIPVALVAHADTVFSKPPKLDNFFYDQERDVIWNPDGAGADDRAGIYAITEIIRGSTLRPHIIITTGEESGCIGANKLVAQVDEFPGELKFMIQLDRRGKEDSVFYDCDNIEFEDFVNQFGFKTEWGTFTDISILAPVWKVAAVNFSIGYEDEHHAIERLHVDWMHATIEKVKQILQYVIDHPEMPTYEYIESIYSWHYGCGYSGHRAWYDYDDDYTIGSDESHCFMCNAIDKTINMMPIWYPYGTHPYQLCMNCYPSLVNQIVWCNNCNRGIFLSKKEADSITDKNSWVCEDCINGIKKGTRTVQQSSVLQSGDVSKYDTNRHYIPKLESSKSPILEPDEWDDIRTEYAGDL